MEQRAHPPGEVARSAGAFPRTRMGEKIHDLPPSGRGEAQRASRAREIREFFNHRAAHWDRTQDAATLERSRRLVLSLGIEPGSRVLDAGCGTGILLPGLLEAVGPQGKVYAMDVAEKMLEVASSKLQRANLEYVHADIAAAPFPDGSFDLVVCHNCFPHVSDKRGAISEIFRLLRPGGRAVVSHTEGREEVNARHLRMGGAVAGDLLPDEATMRRWFREAGFEVLRLRDGDEGYLLEARKPTAKDIFFIPGDHEHGAPHAGG